MTTTLFHQMRLVFRRRPRFIGPLMIGLLLQAMTWPADADSIVNSKHNLSSSGPGTVKALSEQEICIFCHTPHNSVKDAPLWNRFSSGASYTPYSSSTTKATVGQPTGSSKLCLSCHDGTIALGMVRSRTNQIAFAGTTGLMPAGTTKLGTDLSDDHPISFVFDTALAGANGQLKNPTSLDPAIHLENGQVQCNSCHDAHNNQYGKFLVMNNAGSALCINCHNKTGWTTASHATSTKTWNGIAPNPWPHTQQTTVAANACENCHSPHNAGNKQRLLNYAGEESNCYPCHNGNVSKNIQADFNKVSVHPVALTTGIHDPIEDTINPSRHVECADCHNPHASTAATAVAPLASGAITGVKGVNTAGTVVSAVANEYELCFRCHADSVSKGPARITRQFVQTNMRLAFSTANKSYHPVEQIGVNTSVPSLIAPLTTSSLIYCTSCHNSDAGTRVGGTGPNGPHGSAYVPILERRQELTDNQSESAAVYALCYKCHSRTVVLGSTSWSRHNLHVVNVRGACTTCHDPHGVATVPHLINFNRTYVSPGTNGRLEYISTGVNHGTCSLTCHGEDHQAVTY